jgi:hypothetical protein
VISKLVLVQNRYSGHMGSFLRNPPQNRLGENSKRPGREVILLTSRYYAFSLRGET